MTKYFLSILPVTKYFYCLSSLKLFLEMTKYFLSILQVMKYFFFFKFEVDDAHLLVSGDDEVLSFDFAGDEELFSFMFEVVSGDDEVLSFDFAGDEVLFFSFKFEVDAVHLFVSGNDDGFSSHVNDNTQS